MRTPQQLLQTLSLELPNIELEVNKYVAAISVERDRYCSLLKINKLDHWRTSWHAARRNLTGFDREKIFGLINEVTDLYFVTDEITREEIRSLLTNTGAIHYYPDEALDNLLNTSDPIWFQRGLCAISISDSIPDYRDTVCHLDALLNAADELNIERKPYLKSVAIISRKQPPYPQWVSMRSYLLSEINSYIAPKIITKEKINIYKKYNGDGDMWARMNRKSERFMKGSDWDLIESYLLDLKLINSGLASDDYATAFNKRMKTWCESEETIQELKKLISGNKIASFFKRIAGFITRKNNEPVRLTTDKSNKNY